MKKNAISRSAKKPNPNGFTLVELLVVLAVLSLLLAILVPAMHKVRMVAQRMACQNNLRQISIAWQTYLADYDGKFYRSDTANATYGGWQGTDYPDVNRPLSPYLGLKPIEPSPDAAKVFKCPGDKGFDKGPRFFQDLGTSYQTNILLIGQNQIAQLPMAQQELRTRINRRISSLTLNSVNNPDQVLLIGDYGWGVHWIPTYPEGPYWHGKPYYYSLAFLDGHAGFINIKKGIYVDDAYTVLPWQELRGLAREVQEEETIRE